MGDIVITAKEANRLYHEKCDSIVETELAEVMPMIRDAAENGEACLWGEVKYFLSDYTEKKLVELGYHVVERVDCQLGNMTNIFWGDDDIKNPRFEEEWDDSMDYTR